MQAPLYQSPWVPGTRVTTCLGALSVEARTRVGTLETDLVGLLGRLSTRATWLGANAVVGVTVEAELVDGEEVLLRATGTAVRLEWADESRQPVV